MSIELIQAAQQALSALEKSQPHPSNPVIGLTNQDFINHEDTIRQLRTQLQQPATSEPVTDAEIEALFGKCGGHWSGDQWVIEDADLHPFARAILALRPAAVPMTRMKDHQIAAMVNSLRDIARQFHGHGSLRERIANVLVPALKAEAKKETP